MLSVILVYLLFSLIQRSISYNLSPQDEKNIPVFQPVPSLTIDTSLLCKDGQSYQIQPFTQSSKKYVALSMAKCGVYIFDTTNLNNPQIVFNDTLALNGTTQGITYSDTTNFLWIGHSTGLFFGIDTKIWPFSITIKGVSKGNLSINQIVLWPLDNNVLFLMCYTQFQIFDFRQPSQGFIHLQSVIVNGINTLQIEFIRQYSFALVTTSNVGVQFFKVNNGQNISSISFTYSCFLKPLFFDVVNFQLLDENTIAIMMQYRGAYIFNIQNFLDSGGQTCTSTIFQQIDLTEFEGLGGQMYLSQNRRYLYTQFRSLGVQVYDVQNKTFQIVQRIFVDSSSNDIKLSSSEDLLYYTNSLTLQIFERTTPNFNRDVPNLMLNQYQLSSYNFYKENRKHGSLDYSCIFNQNKQELYIARADYGSAAFKYSGQGILESLSFVYRQSSSSFPNSKISFLKDNSTAYLTRIGAGLSIIDFSNSSSPVILKENVTLSSPFVAYIYVDFFKDFQFGIVVNYINGYIISIKDPLNPFIVSVIDTYKYTQGDTSFNAAFIGKDENKIFMRLDTYGILVGNITDLLNPQIVSSYFSYGTADFKLTQDQQYGILAATFKGIIILQNQPNYTLTELSQLKIVGSLHHIILISNDQYILATTYEYPSIILISIVDILKPTIVQIIGDSGVFGYYSLCLTSDNTQVFITGQYFLYLLQIQNQIILHTQIYLVQSLSNSNEFKRQVLPKGQPLQVGQKIEMHLVPIYQSQSIRVNSAQYYFQNILQALPSWIIFQPGTQILSLSISKDSLQKDSEGQYIDTIQQVVFLTYQQVVDSAFVNNYLQINDEDSLSIKEACIINGIMDQSGFVQPSYTPSQELNLGINEQVYLAKWQDSNLSLVKQFIQYVINQNIINYTISFYITQSIQVDLKNKNQIIFSIQNDITVQLQIVERIDGGYTLPTNKIKFVNKSYPSVLILISSAQDQLKLEGSLNNINSILQNGVKYSISNNISSEDILIQMTVSDGVNYDYINTFSYKDLIFLSLQTPVTLSKDINLQSDFNSKYDSGKIYIYDSFQYQISSSVFTCNDSPILQYSVQIKQQNKFVDIPKGYWIQFSPTERVLTGNPPVSYFNNFVVIQVNATDGYTYSVDQFTINPCMIPFSLAIQLAIQILGPIFGILGLYKYKHLIYNIYFKQQYIYSKDVAYVGEIYQKQITITNDVRGLAKKLWIFFQKTIGEKEILSQLSMYLMKENQTTSYKYFNPKNTEQDLKNIEEEDYISFEEEVINKMYPFGVNKDEIAIVDRKSKNIMMQSSQKFNPTLKRGLSVSKAINQNENSQKLESSHPNMQTNTINFQKNNQIEQNQNHFRTTKYEIKQKSKLVNQNVNSKSVADCIRCELLEMSSLHIKMEQSNINDHAQNEINLFENGEINFLSILQFIKQKQENLNEKNRILNKKQLESLLIRNSLLSQAVCCYFVDYLIEKDKITKKIFECMQSKACQYYLEIDWYKAYVDIKPSFDNLNSYPEMNINEKTYSASLREIFSSISKYYYDPNTKNPKEIKFFQDLLKEAIKSRAIGFSSKSTKFLQVTQGESLHTYSHLIQSVQTFEQSSYTLCCYTLRKLLDIHYLEKGLADNDKLPSWIHSIDLINGVILISGIPEKKDIGSILIKVIDSSKFIVKSFEIQVLQKQTENNYEKIIQTHGQNHAQFSNIQNNSDQSQFNQQKIFQKMRQKKASTFAKNANAHFEVSLTSSYQINDTNQFSGISFPCSPINQNKYAELDEQLLQLDVQEIELKSMNSAQQNIEQRKPQLVKSLKQSDFTINTNQQANTEFVENSILMLNTMSFQTQEKDNQRINNIQKIKKQFQDIC
ncbi:hypothetical protein TTHERM_001028831 (macronuclear) [Tetrahymena thermophila SB210]|uniref:Transmembrane protein n=1 Tax=Tetrahymena thermophila (strain SB210) TaxID=312017 RepID=W7X5C2_TETTS|nr:hypothetical protein TTHERM_001028831 [Tetrahymena thermophila SB210]EWS74565.1 hypothetical protein TTHERM_001028831 [Tetrahymena thermophila SB210]|eukprot:XP_012652897.1 hypothetical protein TTHERM_001028831 [Tetrahymena thermophila SB210]